MKNNPNTQNARIRKHLRRGGTITALQAIPKFGCINLSGRIAELRAEGMDIRNEWITTPITNKRIVKYYLAK